MKRTLLDIVDSRGNPQELSKIKVELDSRINWARQGNKPRTQEALQEIRQLVDKELKSLPDVGPDVKDILGKMSTLNEAQPFTVAKKGTQQQVGSPMLGVKMDVSPVTDRIRTGLGNIMEKGPIPQNLLKSNAMQKFQQAGSRFGPAAIPNVMNTLGSSMPQQQESRLGMMDTGSLDSKYANMSPEDKMRQGEINRQRGFDDYGNPVYGGGLGMGQAEQIAQQMYAEGASVKEIKDFMEIAPMLGFGGGAGAGGQQKMTEKQAQFVNAAGSAQEALDLLESGKASTGKLQQFKGGIESFLGTQSNDQTDYRSRLALARGLAMNALAGANVSESEAARIAASIPEEGDEPEIAKQKLRSFISQMSRFGGVETQPTMLQPQDSSSLAFNY